MPFFNRKGQICYKENGKCLFQKYLLSKKVNMNQKTSAKQISWPVLPTLSSQSLNFFSYPGLSCCLIVVQEKWGRVSFTVRHLSLEAPPTSTAMLFLCSALLAVVSSGNGYICYAAKGNQQSNIMTIPGPLTTSLLPNVQEEY